MTARALPRLFLVRHGETEWSRNGSTGRTDICLTARGEEQVRAQATVLVGDERPIDPKNICTAIISPRIRAHKTFHLLFEHLPEFPDHLITEEVREWDYGEYEGLVSGEIVARDPGWNIWKSGCPGGESAEEMQARVDRVIAKVRDYHRKWFEEGKGSRDVLIVAHGHFNRAIIARWNKFELALGTLTSTVEPGGVAVLSYSHHSLDEPVLDGLNLYAHEA
ncbi:histidine phosphatase superfamily [Pisolithus albus]|nr:histidine phosphatase superfamily [Pisolithus albus]